MLRDRRVLIENELKLAKENAAKYYLTIVTGRASPLSEQYYYKSLKARVEDLQFDLAMLNELIEKGHE